MSLIIHPWKPFRRTKKVKNKNRKIAFVTIRDYQDQPFLPSLRFFLRKQFLTPERHKIEKSFSKTQQR